MPEQRNAIDDEDDNWLSKEWWQKEFPPSEYPAAHRRLRFMQIMALIALTVTAANMIYVYLF